MIRDEINIEIDEESFNSLISICPKILEKKGTT